MSRTNPLWASGLRGDLLDWQNKKSPGLAQLGNDCDKLRESIELSISSSLSCALISSHVGSDNLGCLSIMSEMKQDRNNQDPTPSSSRELQIPAKRNACEPQPKST